jgi:hypothetical protein
MIVLNAFWKKGSYLVAFVLAICVVGCAGMPRAGVPSFVKSVEEDHGTYYRLKVKLTYKGEPQDFNIVVGCNVREIIYKDNSSTYEAGLIPTVFGRRMSDGKGLVVRPPNACDGQTTANGEVQPDLLPVVVVYDDAETLTFGIAYLTEDAYKSPLSVLKFGGATIETATRADFDQFRHAQPNLVRRESYFAALDSDAALKAKGFTRVTRPFGNLCQTYMRFRIPDELRTLVDRQWPRSRPIYWRADTYEAESEITKQIWGRAQILTDRPGDPPRPWAAYMELEPSLTADSGLVTRIGGGLVSRDRVHLFPPSLYPATDDYEAHRWPVDRSLWLSFLAGKDVFVTSDLDFRGGQTRGLAYCGVDPRSSADREINAAITRKPKTFRVDGYDVVSKRPAVRGEVWIFERDEYVFRFFDINLESTRGDV